MVTSLINYQSQRGKVRQNACILKSDSPTKFHDEIVSDYSEDGMNKR